MALSNTTADPKQKHVFVAFLEDPEFTDGYANKGTVGYIISGEDQADLLRSLDDLRSGRRPKAEARRVNVQLCPPCAKGKSLHLSPREMDVLRALAHGLSYKMIAVELRISFETVRSHMKCIYNKLDVNNNTAAVLKAIHSGLVAA